jgi:integrase
MGEENIRLGRVNGTFYAVWNDEAGRRQRRSLGTDDPATAKARLGEFKRQFAFQASTGEALTVAAIYEAYVRDRESEGKVAAPRMRDAWKRLKGTFGPLLPIHVTKDVCRAYTASRNRAGATNGTIHVELGYLRSALKFAWREGWIVAVPHVPLPRKPAPQPRALTREEAERLVDSAIQPHVRLFLLLALTTAGRAGAILDLTWNRVDLERRTIRLRDPDRDETPKGRATVPINDTALDALQDARRGAVSEYVIEWAGDRVRSVKKGVGSAAKRAGVKCSPHVLRHTAAVLMAEAGRPMSEIAQFLGHETDRVTQKTYARYSPTYLREAAKALEFPAAGRNRLRGKYANET